jgi:hypothetical protein
MPKNPPGACFLQMRAETHLTLGGGAEGDVAPPPTSFSGEVGTGRGRPKKKSRFSGPDRKFMSDFKKNYDSCIFGNFLFTNLILSAFHLQGSMSNIYACVCQ